MMNNTTKHDSLMWSAAALPLAQREAIVRRFNERVTGALRDSPPTKDLVRRALRRQGVPRCLVRVQRLSLDVILRYGDDLADLFCAYPDDLISPHPYDFFVGYQKPHAKDSINPIQVLTEPATWTDEWGTRWEHAAGGVGATATGYPLRDWSQLDDYLAHQLPDPRAPDRLDAAAAAIRQHGPARYCMGVNVLTIFERLHNLRGMQDALVDLCTHETEVRRLLESLTEYHLELIRYWAEIGADGMFLGDDWGSQRGMIISAAMWRRLFRTHYVKLFDETHRCGMDVIYHSCGNVMDIIPDLIDIGADVLDPIQPVAMDAREIARQFGGRIAFYGGINTQELAGYTPEQVKDEVRRLIDTLGTPFGNAYMIAPANVLTPEVPLENIVALCEACHRQ
jgi:uroporphyrinogen decarboxylase